MPLATMPLTERQARWERMRFLKYQMGKTYEEIGEEFNLTRTRAEAIIKRPKPTRQYGGRPRKA